MWKLMIRTPEVGGFTGSAAAVASVLALVSGASISTVITARTMKKKYQEIADQEIAAYRAEYQAYLAAETERKNKELQDEALEKFAADEAEDGEPADDLGEAETNALLTQYRTLPDASEVVVVTSKPVKIVEHSVWEDSGDVWDYEHELRNRDPQKPYVISFEEYAENVTGYEQATLTYYVGDDVVADEADNPVPDTDGTIGDSNLDLFGHGSKDKNTVYVRNDEKGVDFEIARHEGKFTDVVLGFVHDEAPSPAQQAAARKAAGPTRRMRRDDG